jgi:ABC-type multidrug transport system ATPase subunit
MTHDSGLKTIVIHAEKLGKRFNREWVFRNLNLSFHSGKSYAVTGPNGSGKSTLLQILSGIIPLSEGNLSYQENSNIISGDDFYKYISIAAPYQELIEEFTLMEMINFHLKFRTFKSRMNAEEFVKKVFMASSQNKEIRNFSSGMKQRLKLGMALFTDSPVLLLDEPTSNLDSHGINWYLSEINNQLQDRLVIICSNQKYEYDFCDEVVRLEVGS